MRTSLTGVWGGLALLLVVGCAGAEVEPQFNMEEKSVAVIPFVDREVPIGPSDMSVALTREVAMDIIENNLDDIEVHDPRVVEQFFEGRDIREMTTQEIGVALAVDYIIHGEIYRFDTRGDTIGLNQGIFRGKVWVHKVAKDLTVFERLKNVEFPPVPVAGVEEDDIRIGLIRRTGAAIGRMFYHYEPEEEGWEIPR